MSKGKCYIAGKIGDLPQSVYEANFERAKEEVVALGYEPISPVELEHNHDKSWNSYMKEDLKHMLNCQAVFAQRNWRLSPGATIEINLALAVGINIIHQ